MSIKSKIKTIMNKSSFILGLIFVLIIGGIFFIIYDLNKIYPIYADDWDYHFRYYEDHMIRNVFEVFPSMMKHYTMWGGRLVVHGTLQVLLYCGHWWCDFLNSIMFIVYILLIYFIANRGNKINIFLLCLIFLLVWFFQPSLGMTILWITGSINYLWGTCIVLAFLYPYYCCFTDCYNKIKKDIWAKDYIYKNIFFFIAGVIAGWTNETTAISLFVILVMFIGIEKYIIRISIPKWSIYGLIGSTIGTVLMLIAPGNFRRYEIENKMAGVKGGSTLDIVIEHISDYWDRLTDYALIIALIGIVCILLFRFFSTKKNVDRTVIVTSIFLMAALASSLEYLIILRVGSRGWFGIITLVIISISTIYANIDFSKLYIKVVSGITLVILFAVWGNMYSFGRTELKIRAEIIDKREAEVLKQKAEGKKDIVLTGGLFDMQDKSSLTMGLYEFPKDDYNDWLYKAYINYYDINSIQIVD